MGSFRLQSVAEAEVAEALDWYRGRSAGAARGFLSELDRTFSQIQTDPGRFPLVTRERVKTGAAATGEQLRGPSGALVRR